MLHGEGGIWGKIQGVWPHWSLRKSVPGRGNGGEGQKFWSQSMPAVVKEEHGISSVWSRGREGWVIDEIRELVRGWDCTRSWGMLLRMQLLLWARWEELWVEEWRDLTCRVKATWSDFQVTVLGTDPRQQGQSQGDLRGCRNPAVEGSWLGRGWQWDVVRFWEYFDGRASRICWQIGYVLCKRMREMVFFIWATEKIALCYLQMGRLWEEHVKGALGVPLGCVDLEMLVWQPSEVVK